MKIGVLSDSHGNVEALKKTFQMFEGVSGILHAGDILYHPPRDTNFSDYRLIDCVNLLNKQVTPIIAVKGNCDSEVYDELLEFDTDKSTTTYRFNDINIVINHGHLLSDDAKIKLAKDLKARIFISGHTHIPVLEEKEGVILLNPGSIARPRFHMPTPDPTAAIIEDNKIKIFSIIDGREYINLEY